MSSESSESDDFSSLEDVQQKEYARMTDGYFDVEPSTDSTASGRRSIKESETEEGEVNEVADTSLNTSDEKHHEFDLDRTSSSPLEGASPKDSNRTRKSSADRQTNVLTRRSSSMEGPLTRTSPSLDSLDLPSTRMASSLDPREGHLTGSISSLDPLIEPSAERVSSLNSLEGPLTGSISSLGPSTRMASSLDFQEGYLTGGISSQDSLIEPSNGRISTLNSLERHSTRMVPSMDPLEGPSTQTVWISDSTEAPFASICKSHSSEIERNESSYIEHSIEQSGSWPRPLVWLNSFLRRYSRQFRYSKYYLLFYVALLVIPCSAAYMSSRYNSLCGGCYRLAYLVYGLSYGGFFIITLQILAILSKRYLSPHLNGDECFGFMAMLCLLFLIFLMIEVTVVYSCDPVFIPNPKDSNKGLCIKAFYDFAYYGNMIVPLVIVLLMLIHIPGWDDPAEEA